MATVLIADDRHLNREYLTKLLGCSGHQLLEAADGAEALARVRAERPDLVITDVLMPVMDGYDFVRQLRNDPQIAGTQVIFYTESYHEREARILADACGVQHLIFKPAGPEEILATVNQALGAAPSPSEPPSTPQYDNEHLRLLTEKMSANVDALEAANHRLAELLELSGMLAAEHDANRLLEKFCPAVRMLLGARFAFVGVLAEDQRSMKPLFVSGVDTIRAEIGARYADRGVLAELSGENRPLLLPDVTADALNAGLPAPRGAARSFLGVRLRTSDGPFGLLWVLEKLGGADFNEEDGRVLASLAAQVGVAYENAERYHYIQRYASELERRVDERTAKLTELNKDLEAFAYSASHDLRAPLAVIRGFSAILRDNTGIELDEQSRKQICKIDESAKKMATLIDELLRFSRGSLAEVSWGSVDLAALADTVVNDFAADLNGRIVVWKRGYLPVVRGDQSMLRQVFVNLLSNALKYTRPRVKAEIEIGCLETPRDEVHVFVRDNGVGFDPLSADKLFRAFQRLHREEEFEGTGIGLANIRRVINRHSGKTWAEGKVGEGATFHFVLPHEKRAAAAVCP
jgi:signal transduction histidine kinase/CheY-like chemotaxis protein